MAHVSPHLDFLILGAGWTADFLIPLLRQHKLLFAATSRNGRGDTTKFVFDPDSADETSFRHLPTASTVLISFPLRGQGPSSLLTSLYGKTHPGSTARFIQLGSTAIWQKGSSWQDEDSPYDTSNERAVAEDELMREAGGAVLNLSGLHGGTRQPRDWVARVADTRAALAGKGALHLIHGEDVARAIVALSGNFTPGKRWLLTDLHVYDWWDHVQHCSLKQVVDPELAQSARQRLAWIRDLMAEHGVRALPRDSCQLGRLLDGRGFWKAMDLSPMHGRPR